MKAKGFWGKVFSDWPAKVLSLAVAFLLFFFYHLNRLETRVITVPLHVVANEEYVPSSQYPRTVRLSLRGESADLFQLQEEDLSADIDLSAARGPGLARANVTIERKGAAADLDPLEITPDPVSVSVTMDRKTSRVVPVTPTFRGFLDPGYELSSFDLAPGEVSVEGPASVIDTVTDVTTEAIELSGRRGDFSVKAKLARPSLLVTIAGADSAEFRGAVQRSVALKTFVAAPLAAAGLADGLALDGPLPTVRLELRSQNVELQDFALPADALVVDLSPARRPGSYSLPVQVRLPDGVAVDILEPASVQVRVVAKGGGE